MNQAQPEFNMNDDNFLLQPDPQNQRLSLNPNPTSTQKLDSEAFVQDYKTLRQQQKDFLLKINMSASLKKEIFGFTDLKDHGKPDDGDKLVTMIDPFRGRLIMKEKVWLEIQKEKEEQRLKFENQMKAKEEQQEYEEKIRQDALERKRKKEKSRQNGNDSENGDQKKPEQKKDDFFGFLRNKFSRPTEPSPQRKDDENKKSTNNILQNIPEQQKNSMNEGRIQSIGVINQLSHQQQNPNPKRPPTKTPNPQSQYNIKINGQGKQLPQSPSSKSKPSGGGNTSEDNVFGNLLGTLLKDGSKRKQFGEGEENERMESRAKFGNKNPDDVYQVISEIPKKDLKQEFSSPSLNADRRSDSGSIEQMMRPKNDTMRRAGY